MSLKVDRGRTRARSQAMQLLFQAEALDEELEDVLYGDYLLSTEPLEDYASVLARGSYAHLDEVDALIDAVSDNWSLDRMPGTDRNLLRIAVYEMRFADERLGDAIVINEAVEVAKAFGTDESSRFVNGVLGKIARLEPTEIEGILAEVTPFTPSSEVAGAPQVHSPSVGPEEA